MVRMKLRLARHRPVSVFHRMTCSCPDFERRASRRGAVRDEIAPALRPGMRTNVREPLILMRAWEPRVCWRTISSWSNFETSGYRDLLHADGAQIPMRLPSLNLNLRA